MTFKLSLSFIRMPLRAWTLHSLIVLGAHGRLVAGPKFEPEPAQLIMLSDLATRSYILLIYLTLNNKLGSFASNG